MFVPTGWLYDTVWPRGKVMQMYVVQYLIRTSCDGHTDVVRALLESGVHINQQNNVIQKLNINLNIIVLNLAFHFNTNVTISAQSAHSLHLIIFRFLMSFSSPIYDD